MKNLLVLAYLILVSPLPVCGDVFFGPSNQTNRLVIPGNAAIIISALLGPGIVCGLCDPDPVTATYVTPSGNSDVLLRQNPGGPNFALSGPAELIMNSPGGLSYKVLYRTPITSMIVAPGATNRLDIPLEKTAKFFKALSSSPGGAAVTPERMRFAARKGGATLWGSIGGGEEFTGAITLDFSPSELPMQQGVLSYYFTEDFAPLPELGVLQGPSGTFEVVVEKSVDLQSWFPIVAHQTDSLQKAFYRVRMSK
jgi:hypothetical protein